MCIFFNHRFQLDLQICQVIKLETFPTISNKQEYKHLLPTLACVFPHFSTVVCTKVDHQLSALNLITAIFSEVKIAKLKIVPLSVLGE